MVAGVKSRLQVRCKLWPGQEVDGSGEKLEVSVGWHSGDDSPRRPGEVKEDRKQNMKGRLQGQMSEDTALYLF